MNFTAEGVIGLVIAATLIGFLIGCVPESIRYLKLKNKPMTYHELLDLPIGTDVLLRQYKAAEKSPKEHGTVCITEDGHKAINMGDGYIEFNEADVWLNKK